MKNGFLIVLVLSLFACKKAENRPCFKKSGPDSQKVLHFGTFNRLFLKEHIKYKLIQDSTNTIIVKGGSNLLNFIEITAESGLLSISNHNTCNYLRNYAVVEVEIHYTNLINILFEGTETLETVDTLHTDYLTLTLRDGGGNMNMCIDVLDVEAVNTHGWGDLTLSGKSNTTRLHLMGDGMMNTKALVTQDSLRIISSSSRIQSVAVAGIPLKAEINGIGNIEYFGLPSLIHFSRYGLGDLVNKN